MIEENEILTTKKLQELIIENADYKGNEYLKYLVDNQIISGISYKNFKKLWEFIKRKDIYNVYDYKFLNTICKNMILLYNDIEDDETLEPEEKKKLNNFNEVLQSFYKIIDDGELQKFDSLINILVSSNNDKREKIKLMIDTVLNFKKYIQLIEEVIAQGKLNYREKYALIELLKYHYDYSESAYSYQEFEREFYPDDETINNIFSLKDLRTFISICHEVQIAKINELTENDFYGDAIYMIKNEITKLLTNIKYYGDESLDTIGIESSALKELRDNINDEDIKEELSKYIIFMSLIDSILGIEDLKKLKKIACRISDFKNNNDSIYTIYSYTEHLAKRIKEIYAIEIKEKLFNFNDLKGLNDKTYLRTNSKFTAESKILYGEDITGRKVDYIELAGIDYVFLVHVLNAYGEGGTIKDFKFPRIIGKEYICLSAIDNTKEKIADSEYNDEDHVCLLFSSITPDQLISESFEDLYSYGDLNSLSINFEKRENFRPIKKQIQLNKDKHTEFVLYRDSSNGETIYPSGILIHGNTPTQAEINAAAYLNIPIVFINHEKYKNQENHIELKPKNDEPYRPSSEDYKAFKESLIELRDSIVGRSKGK